MTTYSQSDFIDLNACVISALRLFEEKGTSNIVVPSYTRPLVVGSGNAAATGRILFEHADAVFADEGNFELKVQAISGIDGGFLISASGGKHAPLIAKKLKELKLPVTLLTCNPHAAAKKEAHATIVTPKQREPYTYNTSTYLGMILGKTKEDPKIIREFIESEVAKVIPDNLNKYDAFYFLVPHEFDNIREFFLTKFDELFGAQVSGRAFTVEQTKHAKTVVSSERELFISLGTENNFWGGHRLSVPLPAPCGYAAILAIGYYVIGAIQTQHEPFFKENIVEYCQKASQIFGEDIKPIVE